MIPGMNSSFLQVLAAEKTLVETHLRELLPPAEAWPRRLHRAMRHAVLGGGKRIRAILARVATRALGEDPARITGAACGLELIHCYSLVHDDLPALDNDVLRRGRDTVHVAFDEPTAILVGDALLTEGLGILARKPEGTLWKERRAEVVALVARAIGSSGMVGGQMEDLEAGEQIQDEDSEIAAAERLERIHRGKTGALLRACLESAAVWARAPFEARQNLLAFGEELGLAFQIADDILDATATLEELGKSPGKDERANKLTYLQLYGEEKSRQYLNRSEERMLTLAEEIEGPAGELGALARFICHRRS